MAVKELSQYKHHSNGNTYLLITIALPIHFMPENVPFGRFSAFHTELEEHIEIFNVGDVIFSEKDDFLAIYKEDGAGRVYARPVDEFFEHVDGETKRFRKQDSSELN